VWALVYFTLFRTSPRPAHKFRVMVLKIFGANVHWTAHPYPTSRIWLPRNLIMRAHSCLGDNADCYNVGQVELQERSVISQGAFLCGATHDFNDEAFPLIAKPITIEKKAWIAARAYVGPGTVVHEGAVVGANACVYKNVPPWTVVGGNPAIIIGHRNQRPQSESKPGVADSSRTL
jgi:putative colanic acid biosynthesis acetyltransferase WcaF